MAKRAKPETVAADSAPAPTPEERFATHFPLIRDAKRDLELQQKGATKANAVFRNALKAYKKAGGDVDALIEALRLQKLEPQEADKHLAGVNWHLRALGVPVGQQLGLFPDGQTVGRKVDDDRIGAAKAGDDFEKPVMTTEAMIAKARTAGHDAGADGKARDKNPHIEGSPEFLAFDQAWLDGQAKVAARMGRGHHNGGREAQPSV